jgi:hypothetical protein
VSGKAVINESAWVRGDIGTETPFSEEKDTKEDGGDWEEWGLWSVTEGAANVVVVGPTADPFVPVPFNVSLSDRLCSGCGGSSVVVGGGSLESSSFRFTQVRKFDLRWLR